MRPISFAQRRTSASTHTGPAAIVVGGSMRVLFGPNFPEFGNSHLCIVILSTPISSHTSRLPTSRGSLGVSHPSNSGGVGVSAAERAEAETPTLPVRRQSPARSGRRIGDTSRRILDSLKNDGKATPAVVSQRTGIKNTRQSLNRLRKGGYVRVEPPRGLDCFVSYPP